jgi:hypothetical protein
MLRSPDRRRAEIPKDDERRYVDQRISERDGPGMCAQPPHSDPPAEFAPKFGSA